ncbi:MAG: hypothetical protein OXM54_09830 [Acidimicrobiaceae bacterium]|nr:hypothetical protein [Acidimicrobiaceae bacterium]
MNDQAAAKGSGIAGVLVRIRDKASIGAVLSLYWFLFWLLNGFDKFFNADTFYGVNFKMGLENVMLPALGMSMSLAIIVGVIEVGTACIGLSVLFFALLTAGAILFGERGHMIT